MTDLMDQRLSAAARRWQAEQPPPPVVPLERLVPPDGRSLRWRAGLAAAAAVVLAGGGALALAHTGGREAAGPGDTTSSPTRHVQRARPAVPWRDLPARHPSIAHREHGRMVTPFDNLLADGHIGGHVHPGDVLTFTVHLESDTDVSLDPCPDYSVYFGQGHSRSWQLNCAQVPFRQASPRGHPIVPAGTRVRFQMRVKVPDVSGRQKVLWTLDGPTTMPGFYGIVHVAPR